MSKSKEQQLKDALIWCSGSDDFQIGGKARDGWERICMPLLQSAKRFCCKIGCDKDAEWQIYYGEGISPDDSTGCDSCSDHLGELLTDAPVHYIYPVR